MSDTQKIVVRGPAIGLGTLLTVLFVGLKLTDHIDWSWVWVLSPLWIPMAIWLGLATIVFVVVLIGAGIQAIRG